MLFLKIDYSSSSPPHQTSNHTVGCSNKLLSILWSVQVMLITECDVIELTYPHTAVQKMAPLTNTPAPYFEWKFWGRLDPCLTCRMAWPTWQEETVLMLMTELSEWKEMIYRNYWKQSIKKKNRAQNQSVTETNDKNKTNLNKHLFCLYFYFILLLMYM